MPSGWTNSGIDWTSVNTMRKSRTEDIVRHLYLAVNERDYWISYFNPSWRFNARSLPVLERIGRLRAENQMEYIYGTLKAWLTPFSDIPIQSGNFYTLNESCFLDESSPFDINTVSNPQYKPFQVIDRRWYGKKNLDYSQGGTLEGLLSYDLGLFRAYEYKRLDLNFLKMVYDLLNLNLKISNNYTRLNSSLNEGRSRVYRFELLSDDFYGFRISLSSFLQWNNAFNMQDKLDETFDLFNAITESTPPTSEGSYFKGDSFGQSQSAIDCKSNNNGSGQAGMSKDVSYGSFIMQGFNNTAFDMNLMGMEIHDYGYINTFSSFYDYLPLVNSNISLGLNVYSPNIINIDGDDVFLYTNDDPRPWPYTTAPIKGSGDRQNDDFKSYPVLYLRIDNQEGFLNYYTEPTP